MISVGTSTFLRSSVKSVSENALMQAMIRGVRRVPQSNAELVG
jgi:hypothetical protein